MGLYLKDDYYMDKELLFAGNDKINRLQSRIANLMKTEQMSIMEIRVLVEILFEELESTPLDVK